MPSIIGDAGGGDIGVQQFSKGMMARHGVLFPTFLMQSDRPRRSARSEILDLHLQRSADASERIGESGDQRAVAQTAQTAHGVGRNGFKQLPPFAALQHRRLADLYHVLWPTHGRGPSNGRPLPRKLPRNARCC